jgi:nitrate reductase molybdenum cofactor assembly chaperone NarJ/NarW
MTMTAYGLFAQILDYPARPLTQAVGDLVTQCTEARIPLGAFQDSIAGLSLGQLQEIYINAFDLRPDCTPNLSYHLFGDDGRRGLFLAELKGRMEASGMVLGCELPDHIGLLLQYMDRAEQERGPLIEDCLLPAISRMADLLDTAQNPYKHALRALLSLLQRQTEETREPLQERGAWAGAMES